MSGALIVSSPVQDRVATSGMLRVRMHVEVMCWRSSLWLRRRGARTFEVAVATLLMLVLAPGVFFLVVLLGGRVSVTAERRVGRHGIGYFQRRIDFGDGRLGRFATRYLFDRYPVLLDVIVGHTALVGPRAVMQRDADMHTPVARRRYDVRPGIVGPWTVKLRGNVAYEDEREIDCRYVNEQNFLGDLGVLARAAFSLIYSRTDRSGGAEVSILGLQIANVTMSDAVDRVVEMAGGGGDSGHQVCFVNADCANLAQRDLEYRSILNGVSLTLADGIGMKIASDILDRPIVQNVNGSDMFPRLLSEFERTGRSVFLLGGREGVAAGVVDWIRDQFPRLEVRGYRHGYFSDQESDLVATAICEAKPDVLFVALGSPRQDLWIAEHLALTGASVGIGVGGLFDFFSGRIPRAPEWLRDVGLEWTYRFWQEPRRMWRRYVIGNVVFLFRVLAERCTQLPSVGEIV